MAKRLTRAARAVRRSATTVAATTAAIGALVLSPGLAGDVRAESLREAVEDALAHPGARVLETPLRPAVIWRILQESGSASP